METVINKLLQLMAAFGVGVLVVLGAGFWLFHRLKKDAEKMEEKSGSDTRPPQK